MKRKAQILILTLISILCLSIGPSSLAQESGSEATIQGSAVTPALASLQISLWPEFDRPDVLVIYRGQLDADTPLPAPLEFSIPASVDSLHALAYVDEEGQRLNMTSTSRVEGDARIFSFEVPAPSFQLEYYAPLPIDESGQRSYTFDFEAGYDIRDLNIEVLEPPTATNFQLDPPADSVVPDSGLTYYVVDAGALDVGEARSWTFRYDKDNADLTLPALQQQQTPSAQPTAASEVGDNSSTALIFVFAFVVLVAVGATAFWLGRRTGSEEDLPPEAPFPARKKRPGPGRSEGVFCHKCGATLRPDSEYCHKCGTPVRGVDTRR
ncbi:MAG: zinc ribbon domain-containing protein [Anaerolineae bacterium]|jgi:hypothetical protein